MAVDVGCGLPTRDMGHAPAGHIRLGTCGFIQLRTSPPSGTTHSYTRGDPGCEELLTRANAAFRRKTRLTPVTSTGSSLSPPPTSPSLSLPRLRRVVPRPGGERIPTYAGAARFGSWPLASATPNHAQLCW